MNRKKLDQLLSRKKLLEDRLAAEEESLLADKEELDVLLEAQVILQTTAQGVQERVHGRISAVVSRCLESVFPGEYDFRIIFEKKRGKTEARMVFVKDKREMDPVTSSGIGCVDIAALALRLAALILTKPQPRRLLIMDEPFKNVSPEYRPLVPELLEELAEELKVQVVMTTNFPEYQCGNVIRLE